MEFTGFSPESIDFLWGIRMNNNRDWFTAHKEEYLTHLYRPMVAFSEILKEPFREVPGMACKVSRIYRDTRMPNPNGPYKESLWISLRQDAYYWGMHPCLYFEVRPEAAEYGFVLWKPQPITMERFRADLEANPDRFLELAARCEAASGMTLTGDQYKRRKPCSDPRAERFMSNKNLYCGREIAPGEELFRADLADTVRAGLEALLPLYEYFISLENMA